MSVLSSTVLNVPLGAIARDLHVTIAEASLLITTQAITFAALLPLGDWVGNRFGRRNVYCVVIGFYGIAGIAGALAPNLPVLVAVRIVQGVCAAGIVPLVMTLLAELYDPSERPLALSAWAMANSAGAGVRTSARRIADELFRLAFHLSSRRRSSARSRASPRGANLPADAPRALPLEWRGAGTLTLGAVFVLATFSAIPQLGAQSPIVWIVAFAGCACTFAFIRIIRSSATPFVSPEAFRAPSYNVSCIGVFGATAAFSATLLAIRSISRKRWAFRLPAPDSSRSRCRSRWRRSRPFRASRSSGSEARARCS